MYFILLSLPTGNLVGLHLYKVAPQDHSSRPLGDNTTKTLYIHMHHATQLTMTVFYSKPFVKIKKKRLQGPVTPRPVR